MAGEKKPGWSFAARLTELREQANLTKYQLAKRTGLSRQALTQYERGTREPAWQTVQLLCLALGVQFADLADPSIRLPDTDGRGAGRPRKDGQEDAAAKAQPRKPPRKPKQSEPTERSRKEQR
jgi:transcriptional regulator with XRE-family HTH domain